MEIEEIYNAPIIAGIYYFRNKVNNKYYIGQAIKLRKRLLHHLSNFNAKRYDAPLYKAFEKYGLENFEWGLLDTFDSKDFREVKFQLDALEKKYIEEYNSYGPTGYNQTKGGDGGVLGLKMTDEQKNRISENSKKIHLDGRNLIYIYDFIENCYYTFISMIYAAKTLKIEYDGIRNLQNVIHYNRYVIAKSPEELLEKIQIVRNRANPKFQYSIEDLKNLTEKEFIDKYKICKKTYYDWKKKEGLNHHRVYNRRASYEEVREYLKNHTHKEAAEHFGYSVNFIPKIIKRI